MKTILSILFTLSILCSGCRDQAAVKKTAALEARVAALEAAVPNAIALSDRLNQLESNQIPDHHDITNLSAVTRKMLDLQKKDYDTLSSNLEDSMFTKLNWEIRIEALERHFPTNRAAPSATALKKAVSPSYKFGVPAEVYDSIAADAERRFPGDYDEQVFIINEQLTAYKKLHP